MQQNHYIIDGFLSEGDTVVTTAIEHNSVIRPLIRLKHEKGINIKWIKSDEFGYVNPDEVVKQVNETTKLVIMNHASNVTGMVQNIEKVGKALAKYPKVKFLVDAAQTLGQYLYYEDTEGQGYLFQINRPIPRQYLRTLTAQAIGKPELADWHKYPELDKLWTGKKKLLRALQGGESN